VDGRIEGLQQSHLWGRVCGLPLEGRELLRDRRSGERQRAGGSSDTPVFGDG